MTISQLAEPSQGGEGVQDICETWAYWLFFNLGLIREVEVEESLAGTGGCILGAHKWEFYLPSISDSLENP